MSFRENYMQEELNFRSELQEQGRMIKLICRAKHISLYRLRLPSMLRLPAVPCKHLACRDHSLTHAAHVYCNRDPKKLLAAGVNCDGVGGLSFILPQHSSCPKKPVFYGNDSLKRTTFKWWTSQLWPVIRDRSRVIKPLPFAIY